MKISTVTGKSFQASLLYVLRYLDVDSELDDLDDLDDFIVDRDGKDYGLQQRRAGSFSSFQND